MEKRAYSTHRSEGADKIPHPLFLKCKNLLKLGRRWSPNPPKQLLFSWLAPVFSKSAKFDTTLDIACGNLNNYPFIKSKNYIGIDMNTASLDYGRKVYPKARTENYLIEELDEAGLSGDLVICTQTIGINSYFVAENTVPNVRTIIDCTNSGGTLVFDMGPISAAYFDDVENMLRDSFKAVSVREYGAYNRKTNIVFSIVLAALMQIFPAMRVDRESPRKFYLCTQKQ